MIPGFFKHIMSTWLLEGNLHSLWEEALFLKGLMAEFDF